MEYEGDELNDVIARLQAAASAAKIRGTRLFLSAYASGAYSQGPWRAHGPVLADGCRCPMTVPFSSQKSDISAHVSQTSLPEATR